MELPTVEWTNEELITGLRHIAHTMERNGHSYYQHVAEEAIKALEQTRWIPVSERSPNNHEYIKNNGLFNVSDGNRSYFGWFDIYGMKKFVKPTIAGFLVDNVVIAWMPLPEPYKAESDKEVNANDRDIN